MKFLINLRDVFIGSISSKRYYHTLKDADFAKVKTSVIFFYLGVTIFSSIMFSKNTLDPIQSIISRLPKQLESSIPTDFSAQWNGSVLSFSEPVLIEIHDKEIGKILSQPSDILLTISSDASKDLNFKNSFFTLTDSKIFTRYSNDLIQETPLSELLNSESSTITKEVIIKEATFFSESSRLLILILQLISVPVIALWYFVSRILFVLVTIFLAKYLIKLGPRFTLKRLAAIHLSLLIPAELIQQVAIINSENSLPYFALTFWILTLIIYLPLIKMSVQKL